MKNWIAWALVAASLSSIGCAMRRDLESALQDPSTLSGINVVNGPDASKGTQVCMPGADGTFPSDNLIIQSVKNSDGSATAQGGGCVQRSLQETWAALNNLEAMRFDSTDSMTSQKLPSSDGYSLIYDVNYHKAAFISVDWTIRWYHAIASGTFAAPTKVNVIYQRVRGSAFIPIWHGAITLDKVSAHVTSLAIQNVFKASQSADEIEKSARDALSEMVRKSRTVAPDWDRLNAAQPSPALAGS